MRPRRKGQKLCEKFYVRSKEKQGERENIMGLLIGMIKVIEGDYKGILIKSLWRYSCK